jgi:hypothetical protein
MAAAMRLSEIMLEHDRAVTRKELAQERAAARQGDPQEPVQPGETEQRPMSREDAEKAAREFLERSKRKETPTNVQ